MSARNFQSFLSVPLTGSGPVEARQVFMNAVVSLIPAQADARTYQTHIALVTRTYKIQSPAAPGADIVMPGVNDRYSLLTMGSLNED